MQEMIEKMAEWLRIQTGNVVNLVPWSDASDEIKEHWTAKARSLLQIQTEKYRLAVVRDGPLPTGGGKHDEKLGVVLMRYMKILKKRHFVQEIVKEATDATE